MTAKTSEKLAVELDNLGLAQLAARARTDEFHDFKSPHDMPESYLINLLFHSAKAEPDPIISAMIHALRLRVINGDFDASLEESDEWAASEEGQDTFRRLIRGE
jgi:hypothetical protein